MNKSENDNARLEPLKTASRDGIQDFGRVSIQDQIKLCGWNLSTPPRVERCIHDLVRDQMQSQPTAPAIRAWDGTMTYGELDHASRRLAHHLVGCGVGPEVMVGLCMDKSKWAVVAMMAILRAGGAVVPLGVQHPLARIEGIVKDTAALLVLVDRAHEHRLAALSTQAQLLAVDSLFDTTVVRRPQALDDLPAEACTSVRPEHVAWVIYTSGSTGKPKGVVLEHGALATSILAHGRAFGIQPDDHLSQFAAHTFDVAIQEIMTTLTFGALICVPSEEDRMNRLTSFLSEAGVTIATLTSTVAALVKPQDTPTVRTLVLMGEAVQERVVDQWIEQTKIINAYGPSECCIHSTSTKIQNSLESLNIGKPLAGCTWVVNPANVDHLVPLGAPGELLLEGPLLARGYLNDDDKTAAAFVTDPAFVQKLGLSPGRRMYRTGDMVQQNKDGSLTYLGRRDTQVKIRGQRVEIGEIESQIVRLLPGASQVCVVYSNASKKGPSLLAVIESNSPSQTAFGALENSLVAPSPEQQESFKSVHASLCERLPRYMIPSTFLAINFLPLNDSGKLDRRKVSALLDSISPEKWHMYTARSEMHEQPVGVMEETLQELWATSIGLELSSVSRMDNFFDLGGDSITAMTVVQQLQGRALRLTVTEIFDHPILSAMAELIATDIERDPEYVPFSLVSPEERSAVLKRALSDGSIDKEQEILDILPTTDFQAHIITENMDFTRRQLDHFAFDATGPCDVSGLALAISNLVTSIESLRTGFVKPSGRRLFQLVYANWQPEVRILHTDKQIDAFCQDSLNQDIFGAPNLARPMFDVAIIIAKAGQHRILFRISHALYDGNSIPRLWTALERVFVGQAVGNLIPVGSYLQSLKSRTTHETENYWRELLHEATIPCISPSSEPQISRMEFVSGKPIVLSKDLRPDFTLAVVVKAAWGLVLSQHKAKRDVVFGDIFTGRSTVHPSLANAFACCARAVPFRVAYEPEWTVETLFERIRKQQVASMRHEGLEFQQILQTCMGWPEAKAANLLLSIVNHQRVSDQNLSLGPTVYKQADVRVKQLYASVDFFVLTTEYKGNLLYVQVVFAADRISIDLARTLHKRLQDTLKTILMNPCCRISDLLEGMKNSETKILQ